MNHTYMSQMIVSSANETKSQQYLNTLISEDMTSFVSAKNSSVSDSIIFSNEEPIFTSDCLICITLTFFFFWALFSSQLSSLTSIILFQAESLVASITVILTVSKIIKTLTADAEQIQM